MATSGKKNNGKQAGKRSTNTNPSTDSTPEPNDVPQNGDSICRDHETYCGGSIAAGLVGRLRKRAMWSYSYSGLTFLLIVGSIGWGLYVITTAGTITNLEAMQRINAQQTDINNQIASLSKVSSTASNLRNELGAIESELKAVGEAIRSIHDLSEDNPPMQTELTPKEAYWTAIGLYEKVERIVTTAYGLNEPEIAKVLTEDARGDSIKSGGWPSLSTDFQRELESEKPVVLFEDVEELRMFVSSLISALSVVTTNSAQQIQRLRTSLENIAIPSGTAFADQWHSVLPSLLLRIGTIVLLLFLVKILVPIFQHNIRIAGFYQGRADALQILRNDPDQGLTDLVESMTPGDIHFGKEPRTPTTEILDLVKRIAEIAADNATRPR